MKVAVVTGAARGIGLAISKKFLEEGYRVAILDIDQKTLSQTMKLFFVPTMFLDSNVMFQNPIRSIHPSTRWSNNLDVLMCWSTMQA